MTSGWQQALAVWGASLLLVGATAWIDRVTLAWLTGMRRPRHGFPASIMAALSIMARSPRPKLLPTFVMLLALLPAALLLTLVVVGTGWLLTAEAVTSAAGSEGAMVLLCLALLLAAVPRWLLSVLPSTSPVAHGSPSVTGAIGAAGLLLIRRRLLETTTAWLGLGIALVLVFLGIGAQPKAAQPLLAATLLVVASLWRRLHEYSRGRDVAGYVGAPVALLADLAAHLTISGLTLMALLISGLGAAVAQIAGAGAWAGLLALWVLAVVTTRMLSVLVLASPTPQRLGRFAWLALIPLAGMAFLAATTGVLPAVAV